MLDRALEYAQRGWAVLPLKPRDKVPLTKNGVKDASTDPGQVAVWWSQWPDANIGVACGLTSGFFAVDIDPRNGGTDTWSALLNEHNAGIEPENAIEAVTGGDGRHLLFKMPDVKLVSKVEPGVDIKSSGYIVVAPSFHPNGNQYEWNNGSLWSGTDLPPLQAAPEWLVTALTKPAEADRTPKAYDPDDTRPGTLFNRLASWAEILEPHGWKCHTKAKVSLWTRPGKDVSEGFSATENYEDNDMLHVFTSSTEFEDDTSYDKFGAWALLNFEGDLKAAAAELADRYKDRRYPPPPEDEPDEPTDDGGYHFEPAYSADHFIGRYIAYCSLQTDAATEYHEAGALALLALATPMLRVRLAPYPGGLKTNLYLLLVGPSTRSRKSTAQGLAIDIAQYLKPNSTLDARMTTEAMIGRLADRPNSPTIWPPDEFGMTIAEIGRREFLRGIEELLLTLYGGKDYTYATKMDSVEIRNPHLSVLAASTAEALALAGPTAMLGGLLPRFGVVFPHPLPTAKAAGTVAASLGETRTMLMHDLMGVMQFSQEHPNMEFDPDALAYLNSVEGELVDGGVHTARLPAMLYKVAALGAAGRTSGTVSIKDAMAAATVIRRWADGAERLQPFLRHKSADMEFERSLRLALEALRGMGGRKHRAYVAREVLTTKGKLDAIQSTLVDRHLIEVDDEGTWILM